MTADTPPAAAPDRDAPRVGVVIVAYAAEDFIAQCLESLVATGWPNLRIAVVDNASPDGTAAAVRDWASGAAPFVAPPDWPLAPRPAAAKPRDLAEHVPGADAPAPARPAEVTLLRSDANLGFAGGVNLGLRALRAADDCRYVWVLNPDSVVEPDAVAAFVRRAEAAGRFGLISGRVCFYDRPDVIQADGGRFRFWMGYGASVNVGRAVAEAPPPDMAAVDYVPGMSMFVSRDFLDRAGPMEEAWFLYYEEIDWAMRRGDLPILFAPEARVLHRAGASIGTGSGGKAVSPLSAYFMHRNLPRFMLRWSPARLPVAVAAALGIILRDHLVRGRGAWAPLVAALRGLAQSPPPDAVRRRLSPQTWARLGL